MDAVQLAKNKMAEREFHPKILRKRTTKSKEHQHRDYAKNGAARCRRYYWRHREKQIAKSMEYDRTHPGAANRRWERFRKRQRDLALFRILTNIEISFEA